MKIYAADFETTSYEDYLIDGFTRVYLWGIQDINKNEVICGDTIDQFIAYLSTLPKNSTVFFHNLKFDGKFIVDYLLRNKWEYDKDFTTVISDHNEWYSITINYPKKYIVIKDSLKKFPAMSIDTLAKTFGIPPKESLPIDKRRSPEYVAGDEEIARVKGDVRILAHALRETFAQGATKDTASADAFAYFRESLANSKDYMAQMFAFNRLFPPYIRSNSSKEIAEINQKFRKGYYGGLCYLNPRYQDRIIKNVDVYDRNSMYPTIMTNYPMPYGRIRQREPEADDVYIIEIEAIFKLKRGKIPFIQSKSSVYYQNEILTECDEYLQLVLPSPLYELFHENYDVIDEIVLNRWVFATKKDIFTKHIEHFYKIKSTTTNPGERLMAKLRLNSLYGKFGQNLIQTECTPKLENDNIRYVTGEPYKRDILTYLPVAIFVTAYAKLDLIKAAERFGNRFIYCDTDSIHAVHHPDNDKLLPIDDKKLGYWKHEGRHPRAKYLRPKVYIHGDKNFNITEIKAAGAPIACKANMTFDNLNPGVEFKGKLLMKTVPGGCVLQETTYQINI